MPPAVKVNQQMIADRLKVSVATVSKALSNENGVSEATRLKVVETATKLGYLAERTKKLNRQAGVVHQHRFIGVLARSSYQPGSFAVPSSYFEAIAGVASDLNVTLVPQEILHSVDDHAILDPANQSPALRNGSLSGLLVMGQWSPDVIRKLNAIAPCVVLPFTIPDIQIDQIGLDHNGAVADLIAHLHGLGHRRIGFFGKCHSLSWSTERFAGYVNGLSRFDLGYDPSAVIDIAEAPLMEEGHDEAWAGHIEQAYAATQGGVTAWVCSSDWPGNQLHRGLVAAGLSVPGDLSITGFDDSEPVTLGMPPLTTTYLPRPEMGKAAVKQLIHRILEPDAEPCRMQFACPLRDHATTAPPKTQPAASSDVARATH
ncbi:LacI family DNA-binding transcriptional regulator [Phycisphaeraceae bacterium D3-23]